MIETICEKIAERIFSVAVNSVGSTCIYWHHQPEVPDSLKRLQDEKRTYKNL